MVDIGIMSLQAVVMLLGLAIQLMTSASQPGVTPEQKQAAISTANTAISVALQFASQSHTTPAPTSTPPVASSTDAVPPSSDTGGSSTGGTGTQVVNIPVEIPAPTSTPPALTEVPFEQIARVSYGPYSSDMTFTVDPALPPRDSGKLYYKSTVTLNGETKTKDPLKEDNQGGDQFKFYYLSPETDYAYSVRVESEGRYGVATGTLRTPCYCTLGK